MTRVIEFEWLRRSPQGAVVETVEQLDSAVVLIRAPAFDGRLAGVFSAAIRRHDPRGIVLEVSHGEALGPGEVDALVDALTVAALRRVSFVVVSASARVALDNVRFARDVDEARRMLGRIAPNGNNSAG